MTLAQFWNPFVWWRRVQRDMDHLLLVPAIRREAKTPEHFAAAVAYHVTADRAWQVDASELSPQDAALLTECEVALRLLMPKP